MKWYTGFHGRKRYTRTIHLSWNIRQNTWSARVFFNDYGVSVGGDYLYRDHDNITIESVTRILRLGKHMGQGWSHDNTYVTWGFFKPRSW